MILRLEGDSDVRGQMSCQTAKAALWKALQAGEVQATGIGLGTNRRVLIPDFEWQDLKNVEESGRDLVCLQLPFTKVPPRRAAGRDDALTTIRPFPHGYFEVLVQRREIMKIWPLLETTSRVTVKRQPESAESARRDHERSSAHGPARQSPLRSHTAKKRTGTPKGKSGRKPDWDWEDVRQFVFQMLDQNGDFDDPAPAAEWKSQNDLIRAVLNYIEKQVGIGEGNGPSHTTLKERVAPMVADWRQRSSAGN
jgi:hypothetical protein